LTSQKQRIALVFVIASIAMIGGLMRAVIGAGITEHFPSAKFVGEAIVTAVALAWWQFVVYGLVVTVLASPRGRVAAAR